MDSLETPMGLALVVCDAVIEDKHTGKKSLIGLFDRIHAASFPCTHPTMAVFVTITGGKGTYPCNITCRSQDGKKTVFKAEGKVELKDPRQVVDIVFRLNGVQFHKEGTYLLSFNADDMPIMLRPLNIVKAKALPPKKPRGK